MDLSDVALPANQLAFVNRFVDVCNADDHVVAAFLGGSNAKGYADQYSDVDVCVITTAAAYSDFYERRESFLKSLGELVFLENFETPGTAFYIFADGVEGELNFGSEDHLERIHSGPFKILLDKTGILVDASFPEGESDRARQMEELRRNIYWFYHEMSHFITAIGRGHLWWARGQLDALRGNCVNLARLEHNFSDGDVGEEPYFKIENAMPVEKLTPLERTFCPMEKNAMLQSAHMIVQFYREIAQSLASKHGIPYPHKLETVMLERLEELSKPTKT